METIFTTKDSVAEVAAIFGEEKEVMGAMCQCTNIPMYQCDYFHSTTLLSLFYADFMEHRVTNW